MKKEDIEMMLDGIDDKYIMEASKAYAGGHRMAGMKKAAAAAVVFVLVAGTGIPVIASVNPAFKTWLQSISMTETDYGGSKGVQIKGTENSKNDVAAENEKEERFHLQLRYIPAGYQCDKDDTSLYYGKNKETDYFTVAYFHLQDEFLNVLPKAEKAEKYETTSGNACIAESKEENRIWILFRNHKYMVEIRDRNKVLSKKEIRKIIDGASITTKNTEVKYEILEWTKELKDSYESWLAANGAKKN